MQEQLFNARRSFHFDENIETLDSPQDGLVLCNGQHQNFYHSFMTIFMVF